LTLRAGRFLRAWRIDGPLQTRSAFRPSQPKLLRRSRLGGDGLKALRKAPKRETGAVSPDSPEGS